jgi:UDP-N-acetylmuramoyl-tripeptide--D-alanyl-D-alanine ligase
MSIPPLVWTLGTVAGIIGGRLEGDPGTTITAVSTDSRSVETGELFIALDGEHFDGNDFAASAMAAGAAAVVVRAGAGWDLRPRIEVTDTLTALRDLGAQRRRELDLPTIAITGSTGKTSTKDMLASILPGSWVSPRSYNNEIGVPLTVLSTPREARMLVLEVGSRGRGHIRWVAPVVEPDVAVITNLGAVHMETFGTPQRLADAKWELVESLGDGTAVLPDDDPALERTHPGRTIRFGERGGSEIGITDIVVGRDGRASFGLRIAGTIHQVHLGLAGRHQAWNAAAAAGAAHAIGIAGPDIVVGLERATVSPWRMEVHRGRVTIVNDAYNANPDSVESALRTVAVMSDRRIAVLGLMAELGPVSVDEHRRIGRLARELGFSLVVVVGEDHGIAEGAGDIAVAVAEPDDALAVLAAELRSGDVVLVKASRAVGLETVAMRLREEAAA